MFYKHGMSKSRPYKIWSCMKQRCDKEYSKDYKRYGGRGITYCNKWSTFQGFWEDIKDGYTNGLTLDRKNVDKGYSKENCRWVSCKVQSNNKRNNIFIIYKNEKLTVKQISEKYNVSYHLLLDRLNYGWSIDKAIETPVRSNTIYEYKGHKGTLTELCKILGLKQQRIKDRLRLGWTIQDAIEIPKIKNGRNYKDEKSNRCCKTFR